jgi:hypothetical protein
MSAASLFARWEKVGYFLERGDVLQLWQVPERQLIWQQKHNVICFQVAFAKRGKGIIGAGCHLFWCNVADGKVICCPVSLGVSSRWHLA